MKKFLAVLLTVAMLLSVASFAGAESSMKVAMITDYGDITDQSFNQTTYEACKAFCEEAGVDFQYYKPNSDSDTDRISSIEKAIDDGFNVIVMPGYAFAAAIVGTVEEYSDITFVALDVSEYDLQAAKGTEADFSWAYPANLYSAVYQEELCGYMAGYAAVKLGYKKLGFLGGMAVPAVIRYGYGFVQGANQAAADLGVSDVTIKYWYSGSFQANDDIKAKMDSWYSDGTEVVFACGGSICNSCVAAAQANNGKMIGVDVDQSPLDACVITSAMKALSNSVVVCLTDAQGNGWKFTDAYAGKETTLGAAEDCVGLPMETSQFTTFTQEKYDELYGKMASGELVIDNSSDAAVKPAVTNVTVDYQD